MVDVIFWDHKTSQNANTTGMFEIHSQTATAPHKKPKAATVKHSLTGVYQSVGYARWQSQATKTDSRVDFVNSNLQASAQHHPQSIFMSCFHGLTPGAMAASRIQT